MLASLQLKEFRCFETLTVSFEEGFTFFIGANGEGKTSILEAACVLLRLQSQRSASLVPAIRTDAASFLLRGQLDDHRLEFQFGGPRRRLLFNETEQRTATEYLRLARVVSFANADIDLVRGGSTLRRRYLDFLGTQVDLRYRATARAYERALRSRNVLLKSGRARSRELAAYDETLVRHGTLLRSMREELVSRISPAAALAHREISGSTEELQIRYAPGSEPDLAAHLSQSRQEEERLRQTVVGPHRDDLDFSIDGLLAQTHASEGQQRTLALALKLAQARIFSDESAPPILLIDDIFGELDAGRRVALFGALDAGAQKLVTATSPQWPKEIGAGATWNLEKHQLRRVG